MKKYETFQKYCTLLGAFLIILPTDLPTFWGNVSVYILSYQAKYNIEDVAQLNTPWILSISIVTIILGMIVGGLLGPCARPRVCIALAILVINGGIFASYVTVKVSMATLVITMGGIYGFGFGMAQGAVIKFVLDWTVSDTGSFVSIAFSGGSVGSILINQLVTMYINPENYSPDHKNGQLKFFYQEDVVDRVPEMFLLFGGISLIIQVVGFCLLRNSPAKIIKPVENYGSGESIVATASEGVGKVFTTDDIPMNTENTVSSTDHECKECNDLTPRDLFNTRLLYTIWIVCAAGEASSIFLGNYYKAYGQFFIHDDHFLTAIGTTLCIVSTVVRLFYGFILDRVGLKSCLVFIFGLLPPCFIFLYFAAMINRWVYLLANVMIGCLHYCLHPTFVSAIVTYFGKKHLTENIGVCFLGAMVMNLISPPIKRLLLLNLGWFSVFVWIASFDIVSLILSMLLLK